MNNLLMIGAQLVREMVPDDGTLEERARCAMAAANDPNITWYTGDANEKFQAGVAGLLLAVGPDTDDGLRITQEVRAIKALNAAIGGVPVSIDDVEAGDPIGLVGIWADVEKGDK